MLTPYGKTVYRRYFMLIGLVAIAGFFFITNVAIYGAVILVLAAATLFVLNFFRNPSRTTPLEPFIVVAPADGKVVVIKDTTEDEYLHGDAVQVSIFMSPLDVHVNRFPISGTVEYYRYVEGEYQVAYADKASSHNERTHIGVAAAEGGYKLLFKQIAGAIARRIVADVQVGQTAVVGETFGMIQFGSRVDVLMPRGTEVLVRLNDRTVSGETVIARYPSPAGK